MTPKNLYGMIAEFDTPKQILNAASSVRKEGYVDFDCHTPFPIHGLDDAMGLKRSIVGFIVGIGCIVGATVGLTLQWWSSTIAYPIVISGKPLFSWQAFMIITFVLMVLGGAFSALLGMFHLNRLPTFYHPLFNSEQFKKATDDKFFVSIEFKDPKFDIEDTRKFLEFIGGRNIEVIEE